MSLSSPFSFHEMSLLLLFSRSTAPEIDNSSARQRRVNPYFRLVGHLGLAALHEAHVLAVDEHVHVAADVVLIVEHALPNGGIVATEHHEDLADRHPHVSWQPCFDDFLVARIST